jgi:hypothetical protein
MKDGLLIGEVAQRSGVTRKSLRLDEQRSILPRARRTASGYRGYPADVFGTLDFVARARRTGLRMLTPLSRPRTAPDLATSHGNLDHRYA